MITLVTVIFAVLIGGAALKFTGVLGRGTGGPSVSSTFATYTPGPTPTVVPQYRLFTSTTSAFILNFPEQWLQKSDTDTSSGQPDYVDRFSTSDARMSFAVEQAAGFASLSDAQVIDAEVRGGQQDGATFKQTTSAASTVAAGGETWQRQEYDVTLQGGGKLHMAILGTHHRGHGYAIVMYSAPDTFAADEKATFSVMLKSFRFTN